MSNLPTEIREEILLRSPASSLVRFKLVCKQWRSLISNPDFAKKHFDHLKSNPKNNQHKLIVNSSPNFYSIDCESLDYTKHCFPLEFSGDLSLLGACNGLLCIGYISNPSGYTVAIWHPLCMNYKILPSYMYDIGAVKFVGFGYDSCTNDYKFVKAVKVAGETEHRAFVFSVKNNSWKAIKRVPKSEFCNVRREEGTLVNDSLFWDASDYDCVNEEKSHKHVIVAFDLVDDTFRVLKIGDNVDTEPQRKIELVAVHGKLGMFEAKYEFSDIQLWVLNEEDRTRKLWVKLMNIPRKCGVYSWPLHFSENDEVLLRINGIFCVGDKKVAVSKKSETFSKVYSFGKIPWLDEKVYVETLVSVDP